MLQDRQVQNILHTCTLGNRHSIIGQLFAMWPPTWILNKQRDVFVSQTESVYVAVEMHCILRCRTPRQSSPALNETSAPKFEVAQVNFHQVWTRSTYPLNPFPTCRVFAGDTLSHAATLTSLIPWPWTLVVHGMSRDQSLYQIWAKSNNPRL